MMGMLQKGFRPWEAYAGVVLKAPTATMATSVAAIFFTEYPLSYSEYNCKDRANPRNQLILIRVFT
jgi:hypothetical protein